MRKLSLVYFILFLLSSFQLAFAAKISFIKPHKNRSDFKIIGFEVPLTSGEVAEWSYLDDDGALSVATIIKIHQEVIHQDWVEHKKNYPMAEEASFYEEIRNQPIRFWKQTQTSLSSSLKLLEKRLQEYSQSNNYQDEIQALKNFLKDTPIQTEKAWTYHNLEKLGSMIEKVSAQLVYHLYSMTHELILIQPWLEGKSFKIVSWEETEFGKGHGMRGKCITNRVGGVIDRSLLYYQSGIRTLGLMDYGLDSIQKLPRQKETKNKSILSYDLERADFSGDFSALLEQMSTISL